MSIASDFETLMKQIRDLVSSLDSKLTEITINEGNLNDAFTSISNDISSFVRDINSALSALTSSPVNRKLDEILTKLDTGQGIDEQALADKIGLVVDNRLKLVTTQVEELSKKVARLQEELIMSEGEKEYIKSLVPQEYLSGVIDIADERTQAKSISASLAIPFLATAVLLALVGTANQYSIQKNGDEITLRNEEDKNYFEKRWDEIKLGVATGTATMGALWEVMNQSTFLGKLNQIDETITIDEVNILKEEIAKYNEAVLTKENLKETLLDSDFVLQLANQVNSKLETVQISEYDMNKIVEKISAEVLSANFELTDNDITRLRREISAVIGIEEDGAIMGSFVEGMKSISDELKRAVSNIEVTNVEIGLGQDTAEKLNQVSESLNRVVTSIDSKTGLDLSLVGTNIPEKVELKLNYQDFINELASTSVNLNSAELTNVKLEVNNDDLRVKFDPASYQQLVDVFQNVRVGVDTSTAGLKLEIPQALKLGLNMKDDRGQPLKLQLDTEQQFVGLSLEDDLGRAQKLQLDTSRALQAELVHSPSVSDLEKNKLKAMEQQAQYQANLSLNFDEYFNTVDQRGQNKVAREIEKHVQLHDPTLKFEIQRSDGVSVLMPNGHYPKMQASFYYDKNIEEHLHQEGFNMNLVLKGKTGMKDDDDYGKITDDIKAEKIEADATQRYVLDYHNNFALAFGMSERVIKYDDKKYKEYLKQPMFDTSKLPQNRAQRRANK